MWCWRRMEKVSWTDHVRDEEVLLTVKEQRNILHEIRKRKANWIGHILCRNCLLQRVTEGKIQGGIEVTGRQGIRRMKLLDDLKERRWYSHLKEEALDRTMWRARFGRGFGPVVRQTTKWMNITCRYFRTSHRHVYGVSSLPVCDAVSLGGIYSTFRKTAPPSSSKSQAVNSWPLKFKPKWFLETLGATHRKDTASHTRRLEPCTFMKLDTGGPGPLHRVAQTKLKHVTLLFELKELHDQQLRDPRV
jgi:hypothetical protein